MAAMGNSAQTALMQLLFQNTSWTNIGNAGGILQSTVAGSFFIGLSTGTLTGASTQISTEAAYTGYARVAVARSSAGWTVTGTSPCIAENAAAVTFPASTSGPEVETNAQIGRDTSGAGLTLWYGALTASLTVNNGITPSFAINNLQATVT